MITHATLGSWPGTDIAATSRMVLGECPAHAHVPEMPDRGAHASMVGRTLGMITELGADLQPSGWRLTDGSGLDQRRAATMLRDDVEIFAEAAQGFEGEIVLSASGPWTLAAMVELSRGQKVLGDTGARRDLAQALLAGLNDQIARLARLVPTANIRLQLDEPMLPAVATGRIRTASGFRRIAAVDVPELETTLGDVVRGVGASLDGRVMLHSCAPDFDPGLARRVGADALALDLSGSVKPATLDALAAHLENGGLLWWGLLATNPVDVVPRPDALVERALRLLRPLELPAEIWLERVVLTPACGLAGWTPSTAIASVRVLRETAGVLSEEIGSS